MKKSHQQSESVSLIQQDESLWYVLQILAGHTWTVSSVAFSPDGRKIVSGSYDNTIKV
ncbi:MAG: WD40 domain-containing protein [Treponema sp.]|jgi:WD40 repeat protein|nr:WD40 domain-containing protein [Treponema sp.]